MASRSRRAEHGKMRKAEKESGWAGCLRSLRPLATAMAFVLICLGSVYGQVCPDPPPQTSGSHSFHQEGEIFDIPISLANCQPLSLELRWSNGRNNGSNFHVTFLDSDNRPIYTRGISGFLHGSLQFPFATAEPQPWLGSRSMISVPTIVTIEAVQPFASPATISYTVTRTAGRSRRHLGIDENDAKNLRTAPGSILVKGKSSLDRSASEPGGESITFRLEEVALAEPREIEINGRKENVESVFRLMLAGGATLAQVSMIWLDDAALPVFAPAGSQEIGSMIYDPSILRDGAEISMSNYNGGRMYSLTERLNLPQRLKTRVQPATEGHAGNEIVGIHSATRVIGATRQSLVQIEMNTSRPFPAKDSALQLQVGKRFFLNELSGDYSGRTLTLTLTPEMFAELKPGAEIIAFFNKPDRSGFSGQDIWCFGRLNKNMMTR